MNIEKLKEYKAKSDGTTIYQHNEDLKGVLSQLKNILNLDNEMITSVENTILHHDAGKAVSSFQEKLNQTVSQSSEVRHEVLSACSKELSDIERLSVLTHHKNLKDIADQIQFTINPTFFQKELDELCENIELKEPIDIKKLSVQYWRNKSLLTNKQSILHKGLLNLCDHIASAGIKTLDKGFDAQSVFHFNRYTSIQQDSMSGNADRIILAPTGTGKTETAFLFSDQVQNEEKSRRVFYLLPYTTSINAMYKRLKERDISVGMLHGKAEFFLYKELDDNKSEAKHKYQMFKKYINQVTVCTIFQILKAFFNCKYSEMMIAMFSNSIFIVDEIHCYETRELCLLLETLQYLKTHFNINICIMSASIPTSYIQLIKEKLNINHVATPTLEEYQSLKRHQLHYHERHVRTSLDKVKHSLKQGLKTLICVNTVQEAQEIALELSSFLETENIPWKLIHGNFNARDRAMIEETISGRDSKVRLLIGTQAIEVSLDIDYDVLYTEIAPLDALLQRFGRVNRKKLGEITERKEVHVFGAETSKIYSKDVIDKTIEVIRDLREIQEEDMQKLLDLVYPSVEIEEYEKHKGRYHKVLNAYKVAHWNKGYASDMIEHMGAMLLPQDLLNEYQYYIKEKLYFEANALLVNISDKQYFRLKKEGLIEEISSLNADIVKLPYDSVYGLVMN